MGLICDKCEEFIIACEGEWEETVVCKKCGAPATSEEIIDGLHKVAQLEREIERLKLAENAISKIGELLILMSAYDWFWRHTRRVFDEYHKALGDREDTSVASSDGAEK